MPAAKDDSTRDSDSNNGNENESSEKEEPSLGDATNSAPAVGFSLWLPRTCHMDSVALVLQYSLLALFLIYRL